MEGSEPLWRRIFLNELLLAALAAVLILYIAFQFATRGPSLDEAGRPLPASRP
ncbi:MAG TPA: hypothetical protein VFC90_02945 [Planctomycetota bacterium]|nr:hypothetical protein [Planctomycetota bacterium]